MEAFGHRREPSLSFRIMMQESFCLDMIIAAARGNRFARAVIGNDIRNLQLAGQVHAEYSEIEHSLRYRRAAKYLDR
jgi:hypothetical protein